MKYFNNYHLLIFDELCESPRMLLTKVSKIIGVGDNWGEGIIKKRVWADNKKISMSPSVLNVLKKQYTEEIKMLSEIVDSDYVRSWHEEIKKSHEELV